MALRILEDNRPMLVFDVNSNATLQCTERGAEAVGTIAEIAQQCTTVFLSLPGPPQIESVVLGDDVKLEQCARSSGS